MIEQNRTLAYNWFAEVWDSANPDAIDKYFAADGRCFGFPDPTSVLTLDGYKAVHAQFLQSFSGIRVQVEDVIAEDDRMAIRWTAHMTHTGDALGIAPTGRPVVMGGSSFCHTRDGKITEGWNFMDFTRVLQQLQSASA
jgi:predicted ester cyclase